MKIITLPAGAPICCCGPAAPPDNGCDVRNCASHPATLYLDWRTERMSDLVVCSTGSWALSQAERNPCIWESDLLLAPCYGTYGDYCRLILQCIDEPNLWLGNTSWFFGSSPAAFFQWGPGITGGVPDIASWIETDPPSWQLVPVVTGGSAGYTGFRGECGNFVNCRWVWDRFRY